VNPVTPWPFHFFWRANLGASAWAVLYVPWCLLRTSPLFAQSTNASLTGRITDSSKGVVPDTKVIVINTGTRVHCDSVTNETGSYYVTNLPPGTYRIEVEKLGFKAVIKSRIAPGAGRGEQ
jgi:hypothetical protein